MDISHCFGKPIQSWKTLDPGSQSHHALHDVIRVSVEDGQTANQNQRSTLVIDDINTDSTSRSFFYDRIVNN